VSEPKLSYVAMAFPAIFNWRRRKDNNTSNNKKVKHRGKKQEDINILMEEVK
jgi:hypothetical protein